jgi:hypothetical protein
MKLLTLYKAQLVKEFVTNHPDLTNVFIAIQGIIDVSIIAVGFYAACILLGPTPKDVDLFNDENLY